MSGLKSNLKIERATFFEIKNLILGFRAKRHHNGAKSVFFSRFMRN